MDIFLKLWLILTIVALLYSFYSAWTIDWRVHLKMTSEYGNNPEKVTFKVFLNRFAEYDGWVTDKMFPNSLFGSNLFSLNCDNYKKYRIHANVIIINGQTLTFSPWNYHKFSKWKDLKCKELALKERELNETL